MGLVAGGFLGFSQRCPQNHVCPAIPACPRRPISQKGVSAPVIDDARCVYCGVCLDFCPMGAFEKKK